MTSNQFPVKQKPQPKDKTKATLYYDGKPWPDYVGKPFSHCQNKKKELISQGYKESRLRVSYA